MARIPIYEPQTVTSGAFNRSEVNPQAAGFSGRAMQQVGKLVSNVGDIVYKRQEQEETSNMMAQLAEKQAQWTERYNRELAAGTLDDETFLQEYDEDIQTLSEQASTIGAREYFNKTNISMRSNLMRSVAMGKAELAAVKVKENYARFQNANTSTLLGDPASFDTTLKAHGDWLDGEVSSGRIDYKTAAQLKLNGEMQIAEAAIRGHINLKDNAANTQHALEAGNWDKYIDAGAKTTLIREAKQKQEVDRIEAERIRRMSEEARAKREDTVSNDFLIRMEEGSLSAVEILDNKDLSFGRKKFFLDELKRGKSSTFAPAYNNAVTRLYLPEGHPQRIASQDDILSEVGRGLSLSDSKQLIEELQERESPEGQLISEQKARVIAEAQKRFFSNSLLGADTDVQQDQLNKFSSFFLREYKKQISLGKTSAELLDPSSKEYLGNFITHFQKSPSEYLQIEAQKYRLRLSEEQAEARRSELRDEIEATYLYMGSSVRDDVGSLRRFRLSPELKRKADETPEDYFRRTGGPL